MVRFIQEHSFGYWLKLRRKALDLTQAELASQVGCSAAAIRKIEAEERRPSVQIAEQLAELFNIPQSEQKNFLRFARGALRSAPVEAEADLPWTISTKPTHSNLPATVTSLIGREQEIELISEYLSDPKIRLVTLMGPPGIGKTRLSVEAARTVLYDFPNGVFFVALAPLADSALIAQTIAQSLGYVETKNISIHEQLKEGIGDKKMLLVLDNCEHLIEDISALASDLLASCSRLKLLATSRESLRIPGEWLCVVPALNVPRDSAANMKTAAKFPALILFAERARAVRSNFVLNDTNIRVIASICAQLDGLPLAIELIAARMRLTTPHALLEHMNSHLVLSADGMRSPFPHQKTLNDAIAWSYTLLSEEEQRLFAYLSVFSGGFTLQAVDSIFSEMFGVISVSSLLTSLSDKSLLQRTFDASDEIRFSMLVTIQQFALKCLQSMGNEAEARLAHLSHFLDLAERADKEIRGPNQVEWLSRLGTERDNLRLALEWAIETQQTGTALRMANNLSLFWFRRADLSEGRQWLGRVVALRDAPQYAKLYSYALAQLAFHTWLQIGPKEARSFVEQALSVARALGDEWNTAWALTVKGLVLIAEENFEAAQSVLEESKIRFRNIHDEWGYANAVISLANGAHHQDDEATELTLHKESLFLFQKLGDKYFESVALRFIGMLQVKQGELTSGMATLREALILAQQLGSKYEVAAGLDRFGEANRRAGNPARAVRLYWAARNVHDSIGAWQKENNAEFENDLAACRTGLSDSAFAAAVEEGRGITMEQAIAYALQDSGS